MVVDHLLDRLGEASEGFLQVWVRWTSLLTNRAARRSSVHLLVVGVLSLDSILVRR